MKTSKMPLFPCLLIVLFIVGNISLTRATQLPVSQETTVAGGAKTETRPGALSLRKTLSEYRGPSQFKGQPALLVFSPDDKLIAYRSGEREISLCDATTGERRALLDVEKGTLDAFAFSPDGRLIATRYLPNKQIVLWDAETGKLQRTLDGINEAGRLAKDRGAATVLFRKELAMVPFSPDGGFIINDQPGDLTALWNVASGKVEKRFDRDTQISGTRYLLKQVFTGGLFSPPKFLVEDALWSADGKFISTLDRDQMPKLWNVATGKLHAVIAAPSDKVEKVMFAPDGQLVATINRDGELKLWEAASGELLILLERKGVEGVAWSPDGKNLAVWHKEREVGLFNLPAMKMRFTLAESRGQLTGGRKSMDSRGGPLFSPDGRSVATGGSKRQAAMVWDVETGKLLFALPKGEDDTQSLVWSSDGRLLVTADDDSVSVWDAATGKLVQKLGGTARSPIRFSRDGRTLATGARNDTALLWNVALP